MKPWFVFVLMLAAVSAGVRAQEVTSTEAARPLPPPACCGPITPGGLQLLKLLNDMDVEHHWVSGLKVDWKNGNPLGAGDLRGHTHCSAFAAAVGERIGVYMLRPPDHKQSFLASAQGRWFASSDGRREGWQQIKTFEEAQRHANEGDLVVLDYINPIASKPGHIAIVRPSLKSEAQLREEGPETTQAGAHNFEDGTAKYSFVKHEGAWPTKVLAFWHATKFSSDPVTH
ncbi:MAG: hypothetical protein PW792_09335 [Acidobacteriaceae bacterium]|nr:hypothetical protein [Acidobacteriaceae bacterium]